MKTKQIIVRWEAVYETTLTVPEDAPIDGQLVKDAAADMAIDVPGSEYQTDTWEVESIRNAADDNN